MANDTIIISGPTAVGKTALSLLLADRLGGEIVSADSMQVYRGMDIGTAKVSKQQRQTIPHHLIDICDITEPFNVAQFYHLATACCEEVIARGKIPIIVGGSGFYIHALLYGPPQGPPSTPDVKAALKEEMQRVGIASFYKKLQQRDPVYAATVSPQDEKKIVRAMEIMTISGKKVSDFSSGKLPLKSAKKMHCYFLSAPRFSLYQKITERCKSMIEQGLVEEVKQLKKQGLHSWNEPAKAIGYRHCLAYLDNPTTTSWKESMQAFQKASKQYAKRQLTWFRKEPLFRWIDSATHSLFDVCDVICSHLTPDNS